MNQSNELMRRLDKEVPILRAEITALYEKLDRQFGLAGANLPITFGYDDDMLGAYRSGLDGGREEFHFSLVFIGYCMKNQIPKSDREDLYKHEYAHYMTHYMDIPSEYEWQPGVHGSAWKYCCSLVGAVPSPTYIFGQSQKEHDYDKLLSNPMKDKTVTWRDNNAREQQYRAKRDSRVQFSVGDEVSHAKFGNGVVEEVQQQSAGVRLRIKFKDGSKLIDQKWLIRSQYKRAGEK